MSPTTPRAPRASAAKEAAITVLFACDGSESAGTAIAAAGKLFDHDHDHDRDRADAVVLTVWEPLTVEVLRAARFGGWIPIPPNVSEVDERDETQAQELARHGARLATEAGFEARPRWIADKRRIADAIVEEADALDVDLIVMDARGLTGIAAFSGSVSNHVLRHASRPTLVVPPEKGGIANSLDGTEFAAAP